MSTESKERDAEMARRDIETARAAMQESFGIVFARGIDGGRGWDADADLKPLAAALAAVRREGAAGAYRQAAAWAGRTPQPRPADATESDHYDSMADTCAAHIAERARADGYTIDGFEWTAEDRRDANEAEADRRAEQIAAALAAARRESAARYEQANQRVCEILIHGARQGADKHTALYSALGLLQSARLSSGPLPEQTKAEADRLAEQDAAGYARGRAKALKEAVQVAMGAGSCGPGKTDCAWGIARAIRALAAQSAAPQPPAKETVMNDPKNEVICCVPECGLAAMFDTVTVRRTIQGSSVAAGPDPYSDLISTCVAHVGEMLGHQPGATSTAEIFWEVSNVRMPEQPAAVPAPATTELANLHEVLESALLETGSSAPVNGRLSRPETHTSDCPGRIEGEDCDCWPTAAWLALPADRRAP